MSIRYPLNFILFIVVFLIVNQLSLNDILKIALIAIILGGIDYLSFKTGLIEKKVPVYIGAGFMVLVIAVMLSIG
ncbi:hypothetical protein HMPREF1207_01748 [Paenibacillus sp. HGH0039]|nr:hypothetical protein HMPREF1207_01748 [Paenibacillus sp. HGH0039]